MKKDLLGFLNNKGVAAILVALLLTVFLGIAALAVDVGYVYVVKNQLQNAADAAALAGADKLAQIYITLGTSQHTFAAGDTYMTGLIASVQNAAFANKAAGVNITVAGSDIATGTWDNTTDFHFSSSDPMSSPNAVKVTATTGPINTFFARVFGKKTVNLSAVAAAALTGPCNSTIDAPLVIASAWFDGLSESNGSCQGTISMSSTSTQCAAWSEVYGNGGTSESNLCGNGSGKKVGEFGNPTTVNVGQGIDMTNGTMDKCFKALNYYLHSNIRLAVVDSPCGVGLNGPSKIIGFTTMYVQSVNSSAHSFQGQVQCSISTNTGGCKNFWWPTAHAALVQL